VENLPYLRNVRLNSTKDLVFRPIQRRKSTISKEYNINEFLGSGAFGVVKKSSNNITSEIRAVKIID